MSILSAENLSVRLGDKAVLNGVDAAFAPGLVTAIVGPNGAGKSTLLDCLAALRTPDAGRVMLDGRALRDLPARARSRRIAYLPQNAEIAWAVEGRTFVGLGRTPYVGAWGLRTDDRAAVARAMAVAGVEAFADRVVSTLSGGERARVLIARALAGEPQWLLADEPLAGLDPGHVLDACDLFRRLVNLLPAAVVERLEPVGIEISTQLAARADRRLRMYGGRCIHAAGIEGLRELARNSVRLVILSCVLEHELDPVPLLAACRERLSHDGVVVIKVPNYACLARRLRGRRWCGYRWPDHVNYFTPQSLAAMADRAGLRVARMGLRDRSPLSDSLYAILARSEN